MNLQDLKSIPKRLALALWDHLMVAIKILFSCLLLISYVMIIGWLIAFIIFLFLFALTGDFKSSLGLPILVFLLQAILAVFGGFIYAVQLLENRRFNKKIRQYIGLEPVEITLDILRSADGKRQFRMTASDSGDLVRGHRHVEILSDNSSLIIENNIYGRFHLQLANIGRPRKDILLTAVVNGKSEAKVKHFIGQPPELTPRKLIRKKRKKLPWPQVLLIEQKDGGFLLFRIAKKGAYAGDTWHQSLEEAKQQAEFEYGELLGEWEAVPENVEDVIQFSLKQAKL